MLNGIICDHFSFLKTLFLFFYYTSRASCHNCVGWNIFCNHRASHNYSSFSNCYTLQYNTSSTDLNAIFYNDTFCGIQQQQAFLTLILGDKLTRYNFTKNIIICCNINDLTILFLPCCGIMFFRLCST